MNKVRSVCMVLYVYFDKKVKRKKPVYRPESW